MPSAEVAPFNHNPIYYKNFWTLLGAQWPFSPFGKCDKTKGSSSDEELSFSLSNKNPFSWSAPTHSFYIFDDNQENQLIIDLEKLFLGRIWRQHPAC